MSALSEPDLSFLKNYLPFWNSLNGIQKDLLQQNALHRSYRPGEILHEPEDCAGLFLIQSGQIRTYILSEAGREITLFRLARGELCVFSASCVLKNIRFDVTIEAVTASDVILIPTHIFNELKKNSLAVSESVGQLISSRFSDVVWLLEQILFMSFDQRLALYLVRQSSLTGSDTLKTTHERIATDLGSAREVVTRMLRYFQSEGIVHLSRGRIDITNRKKLEFISSQDTKNSGKRKP